MRFFLRAYSQYEARVNSIRGSFVNARPVDVRQTILTAVKSVRDRWWSCEQEETPQEACVQCENEWEIVGKGTKTRNANDNAKKHACETRDDFSSRARVESVGRARIFFSRLISLAVAVIIIS